MKYNLFNFLINLRSVLILFLCFLVLKIVSKLWFFNLGHHPFIQADWLINYNDGGFKRRGLSGSIIFLIQDFTGLQIKYIVFSIQLFFYIIFFTSFLFLFIKKITVNSFSLLISPFSLIYLFNQDEIIGRKEIIIFVLFTLFVTFLSSSKLDKKKEYLFSLGIVFSVLFHEVTIFYVPYFCLAIYWFSCGNSRCGRCFFYMFPCILVTLLIFLFGKEINEGESLNILASRGVNVDIMKTGIFTWDEIPLDLYKQNYTNVFVYLGGVLYIFLHYYYYLKRDFPKEGNTILKYFTFIIIWSLPLFYLAIDWGRWLHMHFIFMFILVVAKLPNSDSFLLMKKSITPTLIKNAIVFIVLNTFVIRFFYTSSIAIRLSKTIGIPCFKLLYAWVTRGGV